VPARKQNLKVLEGERELGRVHGWNSVCHLYCEGLWVFFFFFFFLQGMGFSTGVWPQGFMLTRQALYCLSNTTGPFCSGYFGNMVLIFAQAGLGYDSSILNFPLLLECRHITPHPAFSIEMGRHKFVCQDWPGTMILLISAYPVAWDDSCETLYPAIWLR
jgi:hypothetical protein